MITSRDNPGIRYIAKLMGKSKFRREEGRFVMEGVRPVQEAIRQGLVERIYLSGSVMKDAGCGQEPETQSESDGVDCGSQGLKHIINEAHKNDIEMSIVSDKIFRDISDTVTPQGVMAIVRIPSYDEAEIYDRDGAHLLCLEDVRDPGNIGTMIRTSEGAGMDAVVISGGSADPYQPKVVRSTMGSVLRVPIFVYREPFGDVMMMLKNRGFTLYAAHLDGDVDYREQKYDGKVGILIGNEAAGLSSEVTGIADRRVRIPMKGELESLNAAVAAALLMYQLDWHTEE